MKITKKQLFKMYVAMSDLRLSKTIPKIGKISRKSIGGGLQKAWELGMEYGYMAGTAECRKILNQLNVFKQF